MGKELYGQHEDTFVCIAPQRSGKTTSLVVDWILSAPGAVLTTSTKPDTFYYTWYVRSRMRDGGVLVFDPKGITGWSEQVKWNPVGGCEDLDEAMERGKALATGGKIVQSGSGNLEFFTNMAASVIAAWLHAAAVREDGSMRDVLRWASDFEDPEPFELLNTSADAVSAGWPDQLRGLTQSKSDQTVGSLSMTISETLAPLRSPKVLDLLCPSAEDEQFDVYDYLRSRKTLYVLSKSGGGAIAPVISLFTDFVIRTAQEFALEQPGHRLWPTLRCVLDEVTNIAPLPDIESKISDSGGRGITLMLLAQSRAQMRRAWGEDVAETVLANATAEYYLSRIKEQSLLKDLSERTTEHRAAQYSYSSGNQTGGASHSVSTQWEHAWRAQDVAEISRGTALLFYGGMPFMHVKLTPFWERSDVELIYEGMREYTRVTGLEAVSS